MVQPPPHFQTGHTQGRDPNTRRGRGALPFWAAVVALTLPCVPGPPGDTRSGWVSVFQGFALVPC